MEEIHSLVIKAASPDTDLEQRHEAFGELVRRFQDMAYGFAYAILGDFHLAQDAAQEGFVAAYLNLGQLRDPRAFPGWLRQIVLTQCSRVLRKDRRIEPMEAALNVPSPDPDPAAAAEQREIRDRVLAAIRSLPEHERAVMTLFYINGYSQDEVAAFLEVPVTTVKKRLQYSRKRLRERMIDMVEDALQEQRPSRDETFSVAALHKAMVDQLKADGYLSSVRLEAAFRAVPRHLFMPDKPLDEVYSPGREVGLHRSDGARISMAVSPGGVAKILRLADVQPGQRVLEIGAGSGYNAALLAHMVGETGQVITMEIEEELVEKINAGFKVAGLSWAQAVCRDGTLGYAEASPYDWILMGTGVWDIAPAWLEQLKPGGRMLVPLQFRSHAQRLIEFERSDDCLDGLTRGYSLFTPIRGALSHPTDRIDTGPASYLVVYISDRNPKGVAESVHQLLKGPGKNWSTKIQITMRELRCKLTLWLALREPNYCLLWEGSESPEDRKGPGLIRYGFWAGDETFGLLGDRALSVLTGPPGQPPYLATGDPTPSFELYVRSYGQDDGIAQRLIDRIRAWDEAGCPPASEWDRGLPHNEAPIRVRAYPKDSGYVPASDELVIDKRHTRLVINWP